MKNLSIALMTALLSMVLNLQIAAQEKSAAKNSCKVESSEFKGWQAKQISNEWVKLVIVPQLGGRLMQVWFDGHPYLFVNREFEGKKFPACKREEKCDWYNYGGDKIWPLPEGSNNDHQWPGPISDELDDGEYGFRILSEGAKCRVGLDGPADWRTGLQYTREISLDGDSPAIRFRSVMRNSSEKTIEWSVQTVTQYDTRDEKQTGAYKHEFFAFAPANPKSAYLNGFHVRSGLANDPSFSIQDDLFMLHWLPLENEVWLDVTGGWIVVVDGESRYSMVERFQYDASKEYPGKASVIFYKTGASLDIDDAGMPKLSGSQEEHELRYMEAEINSPMISLAPGKSYAMQTEWFPVRAGKDFSAVGEAGVTEKPLMAMRGEHGVTLAGSFGVFFAGRMEATFYDKTNKQVGVVSLEDADPRKAYEVNISMAGPTAAERVEIHLIDKHGEERGKLAEALIQIAGESSK